MQVISVSKAGVEVGEVDFLEDFDSPIVHCSSGVLAALDFDHKQREEQKEHGHSKANTVHSLVANQHITVHMALHARNR